jgi:hypothetical protein
MVNAGLAELERSAIRSSLATDCRKRAVLAEVDGSANGRTCA